MRYTTLTDAIETDLKPALDVHVDDYDVQAIAAEVYAYRVDTVELGRELLNTAGFEQVVSDEEFWVIVQKHAKR